MRRRARSLLVPLMGLVLLAGCGGEGIDYDLQTPPPYIGGVPVAPAGQKLVDRVMTDRDAAELKPVIADWAEAVRAGDIERASSHFTLPSIVYESGGEPLSVNSPQVAAAFNASLPCGAKLLTTSPSGRYVVGTFLLVDRGRLRCRSRGELARVGFVFGDKEFPRRFTEWWQLVPAAEATPGPDERPSRPKPATVSDF